MDRMSGMSLRSCGPQVPQTGLILALCVSLSAVASSTLAQAPSAAVDFGRRIQPLLAKRCYACHGPDKAEGGLRLDQREAAMSALPSGATAIRAGDPAHSELLLRVTAAEDAGRMPPEGAPLSEEQIATLQEWIRDGAPWQDHWAFQPRRVMAPPAVRQSEWVANPIDAFVLRGLEQAGLAPVADATPAALIRRVTYDFTGLPPTAEEVAAFEADHSPAVYERLVDRLLASPRFGEHWARHWLDVVRYADTNSFERDGVKPNAWRYRDYVIRAFNDDKPYDQFLREQIAGDEIPGTGNDGLIATGFYRLGIWDDEPADPPLAMYDGFDDIITTIGQGMLGLTLNCARCHDHKIDPVPLTDYYRVLAFIRGVTPNGYPNPNTERPIFASDHERQTFEARLSAHQQTLNQVQAEVTAIENEFRDREAGVALTHRDLVDLEYRFYRDTWDRLPKFDELKAESTGKLEGGLLDIAPATREFAFGFVFTGSLQVPADGEYTFRLDADDGVRLTVNGSSVILYDGIHGIGQPKTAKVTLRAGLVPLRVDYFQGPHGEKDLMLEWNGPSFERPRPLSKSRFADRALAGASGRNGKPEDLGRAFKQRGAKVLGAERFQQHQQLTQRLEQLRQQTPKPDFALCVTEVGPTPPETFVLRRGNPQAQGDAVQPGFPSVLGGGQPALLPPSGEAKTSGRRRALAEWITDPNHRLTARVIVNRLWQHQFGHGIVRSPNNFGLLGDRPTHPELLDWLAQELVNQDWRLKPMLKLMALSHTYRLSTAGDAESLRKDPLNDLLWRHDPRRLAAEELRDSVLAVTDQLELAMYGPGVYPEISDEVKAGQSNPGAGWSQSSAADQRRRSIYVHVKRSLVLPMLADFDFPETDTSCAARFATTQPTQALGMLNGRFMNQAARDLAERVLQRTAATDPDHKDLPRLVTEVYQSVLRHPPNDFQRQRSQRLLQELTTRHQLKTEAALVQLCLMVLNTNEFSYLD